MITSLGKKGKLKEGKRERKRGKRKKIEKKEGKRWFLAHRKRGKPFLG